MNELVQILKNTRQHLMTGVSHMIPFVVSGGILLAVSVMLYGKGAVPDAVADPNLKKLFDIGVAGLTLMVPFLAAYIGYSIAERSALAPCAIGAWVGNSFGAGFFGALIAGIIGGIVVHYLKKIPVHKVLRSVMPIFIIPIVGTLITAGIMMWGLGEPVGALTNSLTQWLQGMQQGSIVMLAVIMGLMLAFDMGGPVNKVAYAFMLICVAQGVYTVVAIAAVGICIPPLGMGLATLIGRKNFSAEERETGKAALVMGCVGVTEGAIPFAAADPLRVIPSIMVGSVCGAVTACPSGVAHTYMAAEALESAAKAKGWEVKVETQGSIGLENELTAEDVASADMVILTKDIGIKFEERFAGKTIVRVNISDAVKRADAIMSKIEAHLAQTA
ncbi:PTS fructose transporter subunit EIIC [Escherichia coli]|nr:PTS fructose transporter subunit EIIC [Escherichia coli]